MKKRIYLITTILLSAGALTLSSCLKDSRFVDFTKVGTIVEFPKGGLVNFGPDAVTDATDTIVKQFAINVASPTVPTTATTVTLSVNDPAVITAYNNSNSAVFYLPMPAGSFSVSATKVTIPGGQRTAILSVTFIKHFLDPSKSYMLPIKITDAGGLNISGNMGIHYYHFIGNDFAGAYTWEYRRWQNTVGPGPGNIPSLGQGNPPNITNGPPPYPIGQINPVTPTEIQMETGYNGTHVNYDITFTRTVSGSVVTYSNWNVTFPASEIAKWTNAGITNFVPPTFTIPPPHTNADPKIFEMNYVSGGSAPNGRYIDDTYHP